jgi:hypothetical protein
LPEDIDRDAAAGVPKACDAQPLGLGSLSEAAADPHRAIFVKRAVVTEALQVKLEAFGLYEPGARYVVDNEMREVGLTGNRAKRSEFWAR